MTPEKFFDYLEGKLPPNEKEQLERALIADPELQREFATAREIHRGLQAAQASPNSATYKSALRSRQVAIAFTVLVALNVALGLIYIFRANQPSQEVIRAKEAALRHQLESSVEKTAAAAFPSPGLDLEPISLTVPRAEQEADAQKIIARAKQLGGSATKSLPNDIGFSVLAIVPGSKETEFRQTLASLGAPAPPAEALSTSPNEPVHLEIVLSAPHK
ncbi:MAG TPA: hypothetical protein VGG02_06140 [Chthoniobacterales bacterium]|jgi:anti-sigma factor RsiW